MHYLFAILLSIGLFFFVSSIRNGLLKKTKKRRTGIEFFSGIALSALSLCLFHFI